MPRKVIARYQVSYGLTGAYDREVSDCEEYDTRKALAAMIRSELKLRGMPARLFRTVNIRKLWRLIDRMGSKSAGFKLDHNGYSIVFAGLTKQEFETIQASDPTLDHPTVED